MRHASPNISQSGACFSMRTENRKMKQIDDRAGEPIAAQFLLMRPCPFIRRHRFAALESVNISAYHMPTPTTPRIRAHRQPSELSFIRHPSFHRRCNTVYTLIIDPITSRVASIVPDHSSDDAADNAANDSAKGGAKGPETRGVASWLFTRIHHRVRVSRMPPDRCFRSYPGARAAWHTANRRRPTGET